MRECPQCGKTFGFKAATCPACGAAVATEAPDLGETRPAHPAFEPGAESDDDLHDTVPRLPSMEMEIQEPLDDPLHSTLVDPPPAMDDEVAALVDTRPTEEDEPGGYSEELGDTQLEVESRKRSDRGPAAITFSEVPGKPAPNVTGAQPLDFQEFTSGKELARRAETDETAPDPLEDEQLPPAVDSGPVGLTKLLAVLTSLLWIGCAVLMVTAYLAIEPVVRLLAHLPVRLEAIAAVPGLLLLFTLLAATSVRCRGRGPAGRPGRVGVFLRLFIWVLLAALPGVGLLLGLGGALHLILRRPKELRPPASDRPVGWTLLFFTLAWQDMLAVFALIHFRAHIPWLG